MIYNKAMLERINQRFLRTHFRLSDSDVEMASRLSEAIESSRDDHPVPGDIVEYTTRYGDYYPFAHIESDDGETLYICEVPYTPFVAGETGTSFSTSGGAWNYIPRDLQYVESRPKKFCKFGSCGACADGAIEFYAMVDVWCYAEPNPLFGEYTTEHYKKYYVYEREKPGEYGYRFRVEGCGGTPHAAFKTEQDYIEWLNKVQGVEFAFDEEYKHTVLFVPYIITDEDKPAKEETYTRTILPRTDKKEG